MKTFPFKNGARKMGPEKWGHKKKGATRKMGPQEKWGQAPLLMSLRGA